MIQFAQIYSSSNRLRVIIRFRSFPFQQQTIKTIPDPLLKKFY